MAEPLAALRDRTPELPAWLGVVLDTWPGNATDNDPCACGSRAGASIASPDDALLGLVEPLIEQMRHRLCAAVPDLDLKPDNPLLVPDRRHLTAMTKRTLVLELAVRRERGLLCGASSEERFSCMARGLRKPGLARSVLLNHPVLARELVTEADRWVEVTAELAGRLDRDTPHIRRQFGLPGAGLAQLAEVRKDAGDRHRGGRAVAVLTFTDGSRVVYKPRCMRAEELFGRMAEALPLTHRLRPVHVLARDGYGWAAYQEAAPCPDTAATTRFYHRQGAYIALLHALRGHDFHMDNVIAAGEHPMPIDVEALFQTPLADAGDPGGTLGELRESVLATGLPPQSMLRVDEAGARRQDVSGLTGAASDDGLAWDARWEYADEGTDRMRAVRRRGRSHDATNRPVLDSQPAPVDVSAILTGFAEAYRVLMAERPRLLAPDGTVAAFGGTRVRVVLRATRVYQRLLDESWHPDVLRDAIDRELYFGILAGRGPAAAGSPLALAEQRQLSGSDVPIFETDPAGLEVRDPAGRPVAHLAEPGLTAVRSRIAALSEDDLRHQVRLLRMALATVDPAPVVERRPPGKRGGGRVAILDPNLAVAAATAIGVDLLTAARRGEDGIDWTGVTRLANRYWAVGATDLGLAQGICGIGLFLHTLNRVAPDPRLRELVEELRTALFDPADPPTLDDLEGMSVGAFEDLGSVGYLAARLGGLGDDGLVPRAIMRNLAEASTTDVLTGAAGACLVLLAGGDVPAEAARRAADAVLAVPPAGPGFGGGSAGGAYALARAGAVLGEERYTEAATELITSMDSDCLVPGWSGGLAGLVLARSALGVPDAQLARAAAALADRAVPDDSLFHGWTGVGEALYAAGRALDDPTLTSLAGRAAGEVAERVLAGAAVTGVPTGAWTPGLGLGVAGIGYGLLRCALPDQVPSVLLLE